MAQQNGDYSPTYGFIGIGTMGYGMAKNLRHRMPKSSKLVICELNEKAKKDFQEAYSHVGHLEMASDPKQLAEVSDIIITMLPHGAAVKKVFLDPTDGLLTISPGHRRKFFLDCSTIEVATSEEVRKAVVKSDLGDFIDAPVSGGIPAANNGTLTFMLGGSEELYERAKKVLVYMGKEELVIFCGPPGAGLATKQINNYIANASYIALCEGMNAGVRYGLDPKILANVINNSSGMCWNSLHMNPVKGVDPKSPAARDWEGGFMTELAKGVIDMAAELMNDVNAKVVLAPVVQDIYARAVKSPKCARKECRSIYKLIAEDDGNDLGKTVIE